VFVPVVTHQRLGDDGLTRLDPFAPQFGQLQWMALTGQNGVDDSQSRLPHDGADDVVQLPVHLVHGLLHVVHMRCRHLNQALAMPSQRSHRAHFLRRPIRSFQQAHRMQKLQPLAFADVGSPAGNILDVPALTKHTAKPRSSIIWNSGIQLHAG
jgi:hypothetical protein